MLVADKERIKGSLTRVGRGSVDGMRVEEGGWREWDRRAKHTRAKMMGRWTGGGEGGSSEEKRKEKRKKRNVIQGKGVE